MPTAYDLAYCTLLALAAPVAWARPALRAKLRKAHRERNGEVPPREGEGPCVLIHAVSVGEVNATREMVLELLEARRHEGTEARSGAERGERRSDGATERRRGAEGGGALQVVVSVTTDTGLERARQVFAGEAFAGRVSVVRFPVDLSKYVRRFLDRLRPDVAVLMELEVWPNFVTECSRRGIPVVLVNGRMTGRSFKGYRRIRPLVRPMYAKLSAVCAQEQTYARRFIELGVPPERVSVTGTMKFDSAQVGDRVEGDEELALDVGLRPRALGGDELVLVCGSTGPGEEALLLDIYTRLQSSHPELRLAIIPRKPERFDEVARLTDLAWSVRRRSETDEQRQRWHGGPTHPVILGDTMGELRKFYSLADIVVVGRTLVDLGEKQHGSDMIEPAALGKPVIVGPYTGNFAEPMRALLDAGAIRQISTPAQLAEALDDWLRHPDQAADSGRRARDVVLRNRGATNRHVAEILEHLRARLARSIRH